MHYLISLLFLSGAALAFDWQGHRGARGLYPENTLGAMEVALQYPITTLEFDVVISRDKKIVVSHEPWMNEEICLQGSKKDNLYQMDYHDIVKFDCGSKPHPRFPEQKKAVTGKPLMSDLIKATKESGKFYNIEIKSTVEDEKLKYQPEYKAFSDQVVKEILSLLPAERFMIQSFDWRVLQYVREQYPSVTLSALSEEKFSPDEVIKKIGFAPQVYSPYYKDIGPQEVEKFHQAGMKVIPWTVNTISEMKSVIALGVDGIITDYPNLIPKVLEPSCPSKHHLFEGKCVKIPAHALPSNENPGWVCKANYQQRWSHCAKILLPKDAHFLEDGKTWACNDGFARYRGKCKKE